MEYELKKTKDLIPYVNNSRTHSDEQVAQIAASIKEFGFINPVVIDGENGVIAGHGRIMAAKLLGLDEVPCVKADHLTDAQRKAYVIADNQLALNAGWDEELLKVELESLEELDFDLGLLGFEDDFLEEVFEGEEEKEIKEMLPDEEIGLYVYVDSETEQEKIFNEMEERGYKCKIL